MVDEHWIFVIPPAGTKCVCVCVRGYNNLTCDTFRKKKEYSLLCIYFKYFFKKEDGVNLYQASGLNHEFGWTNVFGTFSAFCTPFKTHTHAHTQTNDVLPGGQIVTSVCAHASAFLCMRSPPLLKFIEDSVCGCPIYYFKLNTNTHTHAQRETPRRNLGI